MTILTEQDFYDKFYNDEQICQMSQKNIRNLTYGNSMRMMAKLAFELYKQNLADNGIKADVLTVEEFAEIQSFQNEAIKRGATQ
jgi:hypothetical protein